MVDLFSLPMITGWRRIQNAENVDSIELSTDNGKPD
jgi:hypothetical protein